MSTNFTFRRADVSLFPTLQPGEAARLSFDPPARAVTGKAKAAQNFARILLTRKGHYRSDPDYGTGFMDDFGSGKVIHQEDVASLFSVHALDAVEHLYSIRSGLPGDEVIVEAALDSVDVYAGGMDMKVRLQFEDGSAETIIPVEVPIS